MSAPPRNPIKLSFGLFEADLRTEELWKAGYRVKLQSQPFKVLAVLLEQPGQVVSREELQSRVWGTDTVVDFDRSLSTAINKIREALGDSADNPRFVETLSRRGYRFLADVQELKSAEPPTPPPELLSPAQAEADRTRGTLAGLGLSGTSGAIAPHPLNQATAQPYVTEIGEIQHPSLERAIQPIEVPHPVARPKRSSRLPWLAGIAALPVVVGLAYIAGEARRSVAPLHMVQITHDGNFTPTDSTIERLPASATDGVHLFASTLSKGRPGLSSVALSFGLVEPLLISDEVAGPALGDISPDGSQLLLRSHLSPESEQALWVVPTLGGSAERVGDILAHDATWMPDGKSILFANGSALYITQVSGAHPVLYAKVPGRAFWMRWRPRGDLLRFTVLDPIAHMTSIWQLSSSNRQATRILSGSGDAGRGCCGMWLSDGTAYVFQGTHGGSTDLWELRGTAASGPEQLTDGPLNYEAPVAARSGHRIYFIGEDERSDLQRLEKDGKLSPVKGFLANAVRAEYSRDGAWVAWTDGHGSLWRSKADGSDKLQLTAPDTLDVFLAHWAPDARRLALMAREPGRAWQLYTTDADGGGTRRLLAESRNAADPSWSSDGKRIVFGRINDLMGKENEGRSLEILDLTTSAITELAGSENMFSPRWSPDGRYIAALTLDQRQVKLYDIARQAWQTVPASSGADPVWSRDSRVLFVHAALDPRQLIQAVHVPEMRVEEVAQLATVYADNSVDFIFSGLSADGSPLIRLRTYTGNVFALDLQ